MGVFLISNAATRIYLCKTLLEAVTFLDSLVAVTAAPTTSQKSDNLSRRLNFE